jgi:hypothetical protein
MSHALALLLTIACGVCALGVVIAAGLVFSAHYDPDNPYVPYLLRGLAACAVPGAGALLLNAAG